MATLPMTILYGDYSFPNQSFEVKGFPLDAVLDEADLPRRAGVKVQATRLGPRSLRITGKIYRSDLDPDAAQDQLDLMAGKILNNGRQKLQYRSDRYVWAYGKSFSHAYQEGLYPVFGDVEAIFEADDPYIYSTTLTGVSQTLQTLTGGCSLFTIQNPGYWRVLPIIRFVAGITVTNQILLQDQTNGQRFQWHGTLTPGMTLTIDASAQSVTLGDGTDGLTQFEGDFMELAGLTNTMRFFGATMLFVDFQYNRSYLA